MLELREKLKILHLEDNEFDAELICSALTRALIAFDAEQVADPKRFEELLRSRHFDLAICDYNVPGFDGFNAISRIRELAPSIPIIIVSGTIGDDEAVECLKHGAADYILKDRLNRLGPAVKRALEDAELKRQHEGAYRALRQSEERLSCVLLATNDAVYDWDLQTNNMWWNNALEVLFGYNRRVDNVHFNWWKGTIHDEDRAEILKSLQWALSSNKTSWAGEYRFRCADGRYADVLDRGYVLRDENGQAIRMVGAIMDISDRKRLEKQVFQSQRMDTIGAIAGGVAHDLNNMLSPILVASEVLEDYVTSKEAHPFLAMIRTSVKRGSDLVQQILAFARGTTGVQQPVEPAQLAGEILRLIRATFPKNIQSELSAAPALPHVLAHPVQLHQALLNLCVNARDAMPDGGLLSIVVTRERLDQHPSSGLPLPSADDFVRFEVKDSGHGIAPENLAKIFEPFFTTKSLGSGTGIGLSTVKQIVEGHKGFIQVQSEVNSGTRVSLYFPANSRADFAPIPSQSFQLWQGNGELVLIVEEELLLAHLMKVALEAHNYRVLPCTSCEEALAVFERDQDKVQLLVVDHSLRGMNSGELLRIVHQKRPEVPVLMTTGSGKADVSFTNVLRKPFTTEELLRSVNTLLQKAPDGKIVTHS